MLKSILGTNCDVDRLVPWLRRGPVRVPLFFLKPGVRWSKMCTGQPSFCLPFGFYFSLGCISLIFDKVGVFVGSSVVVPPVFPFFPPCLPRPFVFCLFSFFSFFFSFFFFCIYYEFIFAEYLCAHFPLLLIALSFSGGCLVTEVFSPFLILIFALDAKVSKCNSESFGRSGYIPCRIGKDGGFIRRDRSFHLPRINLAKAG